jgi:hypothetical protein
VNNLAPFDFRFVWAQHSLMSVLSPVEVDLGELTCRLSRDGAGRELQAPPFTWPNSPEGEDFSRPDKLGGKRAWKIFANDAIAAPALISYPQRGRTLRVEYDSEDGTQAYWGVWIDAGWNGHHATRADWAMHLSTLFPEGRLKKFIEVRGCDCGSIEMIAALSPMMRGVLYDPTARAAATQLTAGLSFADRQRLADDVPAHGLAAHAGKRTLGELARELVAIAKDGLSRVAPASVKLLEPVEAIATGGITQADRMVTLWQRAGGDRAAVVRALAHPGLGA